MEKQKIYAIRNGITKELELLTIQYQSSMARIQTLLREVEKEIGN